MVKHYALKRYALKMHSQYSKAISAVNDIQMKSFILNLPKLHLSTENNYLQKKKTVSNRIPFYSTFNEYLPNIRNIRNKNWQLLQTNKKIASFFTEKPMLTLRQNKNLRDLIGQTNISRNKKTTTRGVSKTGRSNACLSRANNQC